MKETRKMCNACNLNYWIVDLLTRVLNQIYLDLELGIKTIISQWREEKDEEKKKRKRTIQFSIYFYNNNLHISFIRTIKLYIFILKLREIALKNEMNQEVCVFLSNELINKSSNCFIRNALRSCSRTAVNGDVKSFVFFMSLMTFVAAAHWPIESSSISIPVKILHGSKNHFNTYIPWQSPIVVLL